MMEEKLKVLKVMSEITSRIDMNTFAQMVGLSADQTVERLQALVNSGFIKKIGGGYGITKKGQNILKATELVPEGTAFHFYSDFEQPTGLLARNLKEFYEIIKHVDKKALDFHLQRGDFEKWIKIAFGDPILANELAEMKSSSLEGETLRSNILKTIAARYGL